MASTSTSTSTTVTAIDPTIPKKSKIVAFPRDFPLEIFSKGTVSWEQRLAIYRDNLPLKILPEASINKVYPVGNVLKLISSNLSKKLDGALGAMKQLLINVRSYEWLTAEINRKIAIISTVLQQIKTPDNIGSLLVSLDEINNIVRSVLDDLVVNFDDSAGYIYLKNLDLDIVSLIRKIKKHISDGPYIWGYFGLFEKTGYLKYREEIKRRNSIQEVKIGYTDSSGITPHTFEQFSPPLDLEDYAHYLRCFKEKRRCDWNSIMGTGTLDRPQQGMTSRRYLMGVVWSTKYLKLGLSTTRNRWGKYPTFEEIGIYINPGSVGGPALHFLKLQATLDVKRLTNYSQFLNLIFRQAYRYYYGTVRLIDWRTICKRRLVSDKTIRSIAEHDFGIKNTKTMNYGTVCSLIVKLADDGKEKYSGMLKNIIHNKHALIGQPGGLNLINNIHAKNWRNEMIRGRKQVLQYVNPLRIPTREDSILDICKVPQQQNIMKLFDLIWALGLRQYLPVDINNVTVAQICKILTNYKALTARDNPYLPVELEEKLKEPVTPFPTPSSLSSLSPTSLSPLTPLSMT